MSRSSATRRSCGRTAVLPFTTRTAGRSPSAGSASDLLHIGAHVRLEPSEPDLVAVEEAPQLRTGVRPLAEDDHSDRGRSGRTGPAGLWAPRGGGAPGGLPAHRPP